MPTENSPTSVSRGVLSYQTIKRLNVEQPMIQPFQDHLLKPASYDLTVGAEYYFHDVSGDTKAKVSELKEGDVFWIPANAICLVLTAERLQMPSDVVGHLTLPLRLQKQGLIMAPQTQIDPGYKGKLVIMLYNLSNHEVKLAANDHVGTMEFRFTDFPPTKQYDKPGIETLGQYITTPLNSSLFDMRSKVDTWTNRITVTIPWLIATIAVMMTVITAMFTFFMARLLPDTAPAAPAAVTGTSATAPPVPPPSTGTLAEPSTAGGTVAPSDTAAVTGTATMQGTKNRKSGAR